MISATIKKEDFFGSSFDLYELLVGNWLLEVVFVVFLVLMN